jgi:hypothetical protein
VLHADGFHQPASADDNAAQAFGEAPARPILFDDWIEERLRAAFAAGPGDQCRDRLARRTNKSSVPAAIRASHAFQTSANAASEGDGSNAMKRVSVGVTASKDLRSIARRERRQRKPL